MSTDRSQSSPSLSSPSSSSLASQWTTLLFGASSSSSTEDESSSLREPLLAEVAAEKTSISKMKKTVTFETTTSTQTSEDDSTAQLLRLLKQQHQHKRQDQHQPPQPRKVRRVSTTKPTKRPSSSANAAAASSESALLTNGQTRYLHFLSFLTGSWMALHSQILLRQMISFKDLLSSSTLNIDLFSLGWSFLTCFIVFLSAIVWGRLLEQKLSLSRRGPSSSSSKKNYVFQMEAHLIVGALLTISAVWMLFTTTTTIKVNVQNTFLQRWFLPATSLVSMALWFPFVSCLLPKIRSNNKSSSSTDNLQSGSTGIMNTYQMIALSLGLVTGMCGQFVLSLFLWHKDWVTSADRILFFSLIWSFATVFWAAIGVATLRWLVQDGDADDRSSSSQTPGDVVEHALFQMESRFIVGSLIGICTAWMVIDWVFDIQEQIFPCLVLLSLSLAAFFVILACFPEKECLSANLQGEELLVLADADENV